MKKRLCKILGFVLIVIGFVLILSSFQFTGFVILEKIGISKNVSGVFGLLAILIGFILIKSSGLVDIIQGKKKRDTPSPPSSILEAAQKGMLRSYLAGKRLIPETNLKGTPYDKHTQYIRRKTITQADFLKRVGHESQYLPRYTLREIREFERKVALKGRGYSAKPNIALVYGISNPKRGPAGAYDHRLVAGIVVELQERPDGIYFHGYPIPIDDIPNEIRKEIRSKKKSSSKK